MLAMLFVALGVVAMVAGLGSLVFRHLLARNMSRANVISREGNSAPAFVVALGVIQLALGVLFFSLAIFIPQRLGETELYAFASAILIRMGDLALIFTVAWLVSGIIFVILGVAVVRRAGKNAASPDLGSDEVRVSLRSDRGYISGTVALTYGTIAIGTGVIFSTVLISSGNLS